MYDVTVQLGVFSCGLSLGGLLAYGWFRRRRAYPPKPYVPPPPTPEQQASLELQALMQALVDGEPVAEDVLQNAINHRASFLGGEKRAGQPGQLVQAVVRKLSPDLQPAGELTHAAERAKAEAKLVQEILAELSPEQRRQYEQGDPEMVASVHEIRDDLFKRLPATIFAPDDPFKRLQAAILVLRQ